jgi:hypothetical protein
LLLLRLISGQSNFLASHRLLGTMYVSIYRSFDLSTPN